jgi:transposase-like protein
MLHTQSINCPHCQGQDLVKNGHRKNGDQRWLCKRCKKSFQLVYRYQANNHGIAEQIEKQTLKSSGVRDIARNLSINKNTVVNHLKRNTN